MNRGLHVGNIHEAKLLQPITAHVDSVGLTRHFNVGQSQCDNVNRQLTPPIL